MPRPGRAAPARPLSSQCEACVRALRVHLSLEPPSRAAVHPSCTPARAGRGRRGALARQRVLPWRRADPGRGSHTLCMSARVRRQGLRRQLAQQTSLPAGHADAGRAPPAPRPMDPLAALDGAGDGAQRLARSAAVGDARDGASDSPSGQGRLQQARLARAGAARAHTRQSVYAAASAGRRRHPQGVTGEHGDRPAAACWGLALSVLDELLRGRTLRSGRRPVQAQAGSCGLHAVGR